MWRCLLIFFLQRFFGNHDQIIWVHCINLLLWHFFHNVPLPFQTFGNLQFVFDFFYPPIKTGSFSVAHISSHKHHILHLSFDLIYRWNIVQYVFCCQGVVLKKQIFFEICIKIFQRLSSTGRDGSCNCKNPTEIWNGGLNWSGWKYHFFKFF